jgi:hypothetical protein
MWALGGILGHFSCRSVCGRPKYRSYMLLGWIQPKRRKSPQRCVICLVPKERQSVCLTGGQPDGELASISVSDHTQDNEDGEGRGWA